MKRSALTRRAGLARKRPEPKQEPERKVCALLQPIRKLAPAAEVFRPQPKRQYVRSRKLLDACGKLERCTFPGCQARDGTLVACHSNWEIHGKGKGIKADDNRIAAGCARCH